MKIKKHYIETIKTGRYFSLGTLNEQTKHVIFVFHGYAQNADDFLKDFEALLREDTFIIAPEGLSHFYWKDLFSNPVSSWMTSLEREKEIEDCNRYLENIFQQLFQHSSHPLKFHFLAFSQSGPILSRWLSKYKHQAENIFFYASEIAKEVDFQDRNGFIYKSKIHFIYGNEDRLIRKDLVQQFLKDFEKLKIDFNVFEFEGRHKIENEALKYIEQVIYKSTI